MEERDRSRKLLYSFLPYKENSLAKFCRIVQVVEGQRHIPSEILKVQIPGNTSTALSSSEVQKEVLANVDTRGDSKSGTDKVRPGLLESNTSNESQVEDGELSFAIGGYDADFSKCYK